MTDGHTTHPAMLPVDQLLDDCQIQRTKKSGPGGQHRNKVETAIIITHRPSGIRAEASERRNQEENRQEAIRRIRIKLAIDIRSWETLPSDYTPSDLWESRRRGQRIRVARDHSDFPPILAEALDVCESLRGDVALSASRLNITSSQLTKLLQVEPMAIQRINALRNQQGLRDLK